jgi:hypothetical protein
VFLLDCVIILSPLISLLGLFRNLKYTLDDYYDDINRLIDLKKYPPSRKKDKLYQILSENWPRYKVCHLSNLREVEIREVEKMIACKNQFFLFKCTICNTLKILYSSCNSRVCTCCGKKHVDKWSKQLCKHLYKKPHRHIVMTIPDRLWPYIKENRDLLKHFMDCSRETFDYVLKETKHEHITPAYISVLHTYGRAINYNPHIHLIFAEGGFTKLNKWVDIKYLDYKLIRKSWQDSVLQMIKEKLTPYYPEIPVLVDLMYKIYPEGFYIRAKDTIKSKHITVKYIGRYIRHPAIASSRIMFFDDKKVTFYYIDHKTEQKIYKTMSIDEFITAILGHIPDDQFKVIRYYGAYSRKTSRFFRKIMMAVESIKQLTLAKFGVVADKYAPLCDKCKIKMTCVWYSGKGPPKENELGEKLTDWIDALGSC